MNKDIIIVLGMHRSATSLTAMILAQCGLYVGKETELIKEDENNQKGYYEFADMVFLNDEILYKNNRFWFSISNSDNAISCRDTERINHILSQLSNDAGEKSIMLKDPRLCVLEDGWSKEIKKLKFHERFVVVFRHPFEVAASINKRDHIDFNYALKIWFYYNYKIMESAIELEKDDVLVLNHDKYFVDPLMQLGRIVKFINNGTNSDLESIIDTSLRHNNRKSMKYNVSEELKTIVLDMYQDLISWEENEKWLSASIIEKHRRNLNLIMQKSYSNNKMDNEHAVIRQYKTVCYKDWCMFLLEDKEKLILEVLKKKLIDDKKVDCIAIYGYGTLARKLIPLLSKIGLRITKIYDKMTEQQICIEEDYYVDIMPCSNETKKCDGYIINTIVNEDDEITKDLSRIYSREHVISVFPLLYENIVCEGEKNAYR